MRAPAVVLTMVLSAAPVFAQALIEYGGALAPAGGVVSRVPNPASHIHLKPIMPTDRQPARSATQPTPPQKKAVKSAATPTNGITAAQQASLADRSKPAVEKKPETFTVTIQR